MTIRVIGPKGSGLKKRLFFFTPLPCSWFLGASRQRFCRPSVTGRVVYLLTAPGRGVRPTVRSSGEDTTVEMSMNAGRKVYFGRLNPCPPLFFT